MGTRQWLRIFSLLKATSSLSSAPAARFAQLLCLLVDQARLCRARLDINQAGAAAVAARIAAQGGKAGAAAMDIADADGTRAVLDELVSAHGALDGLVCTPAINVRKPILAYSGDEFDRVVRVNLRGNFNVLQAAGSIMTAQRRGSIVLYSSIRSIVTEPGQSVYSMTKAGILAAGQDRGDGMGDARRPRQRGRARRRRNAADRADQRATRSGTIAYANKSPMRRWPQPGEMVGPTLFLLSDAASYVTGTIVYADGGWLAADGRFTPPGM